MGQPQFVERKGGPARLGSLLRTISLLLMPGNSPCSLAGCGKTRFERSRRRRNLHQTPLRYSSTEQASPKGLSFGNSRLNSSPNFDGRSVNGDSKTKKLHVGLECI